MWLEFSVLLFFCVSWSLRKYCIYGESKRAGNGWRVCRTCNFSWGRKIAGARTYWGCQNKKERRKVSLFYFGAPNRTRTYDTAVNSRMLYRLSYRGICDSEYYIIICRAICQAFFYQIKQIFCEKFLSVLRVIIWLGRTLMPCAPIDYRLVEV